MSHDDFGPQDRDPARIGVEERVERMAKGDVPESDGVQQNGTVPGDDVSSELLRNGASRADAWLHYAKGHEQTGFSPADLLTPDNVDSLSEEYVIETDSLGLETNPIIVPGDPPVLYHSQNNFVTQAANARTGEVYWSARWEPKRPQGFGEGTNRGVAVWQDKVYQTSGDNFLHARDRYTGEHLWATDLLSDDPELPQRSDHTGNTQAPMVFDGKVLVGESGDQVGWSTLHGVDAETGEMDWQIRTAPKDQWVGEAWKFSSAAAWMSPAIDPETGLVFFSVGNPDPQYNGVVRPGPNRKSNSVVAVDVQSGDIEWDTQLLPHEMWDYDVHTPPKVFDMRVAGERRRVVSVDFKAGWTYVLDAENGQVVERSEPMAKQGGPAFLAMPPASEENSKLMYPGEGGATEWTPGAYDDERGWHYTGTNRVGQYIWYDPDWQFSLDTPPSEFKGGGFSSTLENNMGYVTAIDLATGQIQWKTELPDINPEWPMYRFNIRGTTATAGDLVFHASSGGHLYALDAEDGRLLWEAKPAERRITAQPVVWQDAGTQYVAIAANDHITVYSGGSGE